MESTFLVELFFVISMLVFMATLYIIMPISLVKKKVVSKSKSNVKNTRLINKSNKSKLGDCYS